MVDYGGAYKGGIIAPGINLSLDALVSAAAKLPRIAIEAPRDNSVIGRTTEDQMHIGIFWGYVAMMEGLVARLKAEIGRPVKVIATGGLATLFDQRTDIFDAIEPDLTIQGLGLLYRRAMPDRSIGRTTAVLPPPQPARVTYRTEINVTKPGNELLFLALGGSGEIGMNVNLYGMPGQMGDGRSRPHLRRSRPIPAST